MIMVHRSPECNLRKNKGHVEPLHARAGVRARRLDQQMVVVAHQRVCMDLHCVPLGHLFYQLDEVSVIVIHMMG